MANKNHPPHGEKIMKEGTSSSGMESPLLTSDEESNTVYMVGSQEVVSSSMSSRDEPANGAEMGNADSGKKSQGDDGKNVLEDDAVPPPPCQVRRLPSAVSECTSNRPDPPSAIDHQEALELNMDESKDMLIRGCDCEESIAPPSTRDNGVVSASDNPSIEGAAKEVDDAEEEEDKEVADAMRRGTENAAASHGSTFETPSHNEESASTCSSSNHPTFIINVPSQSNQCTATSDNDTTTEHKSDEEENENFQRPSRESPVDSTLSENVDWDSRRQDDEVPVSTPEQPEALQERKTKAKDATPIVSNVKQFRVDPSPGISSPKQSQQEKEVQEDEQKPKDQDQCQSAFMQQMAQIEQRRGFTTLDSLPEMSPVTLAVTNLQPLTRQGRNEEAVCLPHADILQNDDSEGHGIISLPSPRIVKQEVHQTPQQSEQRIYLPIGQSQGSPIQHQVQIPQPQQSSLQPQFRYQQAPQAASPFLSPHVRTISSRPGRRKIHFRLQEDVTQTQQFKTPGFLGHIRSRSRNMFGGSTRNIFGSSGELLTIDELHNSANKVVDRGVLAISWFEGTSSFELQEHLRRSLLRKLRIEKHHELEDVRILDESVEPPEEIVLSPYIPDGSHFLLRFTIRDTTDDGPGTPLSIYSGRAPDSPSAAPPRTVYGRDSKVELLRKELHNLNFPSARKSGDLPALPLNNGAASGSGTYDRRASNKRHRSKDERETKKSDEEKKDNTSPFKAKTPDQLALSSSLDKGIQNSADDAQQAEGGDDGDKDQQSTISDAVTEDEDDMMLHSEDPVEARLRQITEMLIMDRKERRSGVFYSRPKEKRQVIFVLANYFVLFLSLIAISAEIHARVPGWLSSLEDQYKSVQDCSADQEALFRCVSNGDFAGIIAAIILWLSRKVTPRIFLFGFETPKKLWTVVYECLVTSVCWGVSYLFIRRGMNPDTRHRFVQKYWKDAVYGSLAGFNAAFMKQILKNLIPQEAVEEAFKERQLKILSWLPSFE